MIHRLIVDFVILVHFVWIVFLIFGIGFAFKRSRIAWIHLGGLLFSLLLNALGLYCPLTYLEHYLRSLYLETVTYGEPFIAHYLEGIIYPDVPERIIRIGEILFVCINLIGYGIIAKRYFLKSQRERRRFIS